MVLYPVGLEGLIELCYTVQPDYITALSAYTCFRV